ncbi:MAG: prolipoprotein diacylglyceryl transferase [Alphaproteobacteria bacterium]
MGDGYYVHNIDPVLIEIGPLVIRWYALSYIAGILIGWRYAMAVAAKAPRMVSPDDIDSFMVWAVIGIIVGGRLGQVVFYHPGYYLDHPAEILQVWKGGMAFHGGLLGVIVAMILFTRNRGLPLFGFTDLIALVAPVGIGLGRIANFINGEHWGRASDVSWAVIFSATGGGDIPRHPSQLYEAVMEGLLLFLLLVWLVHAKKALWRPGLTTGVFLTGYAAARTVAELFREPEVLQATLPFGTTWGQWLSLPMALYGLYLVRKALAAPKAAERPASKRTGSADA